MPDKDTIAAARRSSHSLAVEHQLARRGVLPDVLVLLLLTGLLLGMAHLAGTPRAFRGPEISLSPSALPYYATLSTLRMFAAYVLSLLFTLVYGYAAAQNHRSELILLPVLDVLQSVPILSFLPAVLLSLSAIMPERAAAETASIVLIFTSQAWNMTFSWFQSLTTLPTELKEAATCFRLNAWMRFKTVQLPFGALGLIWNSMMSWAGGWFFLMAAEIFKVGDRDFRLPGLGAYIQAAADQKNMAALGYGLIALLVVIVALDQFIWRPLLAWADRFKLATVTGDAPPTSWFYDVARGSRLVGRLRRRLLDRGAEAIDEGFIARWPMKATARLAGEPQTWTVWIMPGMVAAASLYGLFNTGHLLFDVKSAEWVEIVEGVAVTALRVMASLAIALVWTLPVGVAIGTKPRVAAWLQPLVQIAASIPATALFPLFMFFIVLLPGKLHVGAILLMLTGTQWYLLFNIIAGAAAIPQDLQYTAALLGFSRYERWKTLILPALWPYIITGAITAGGGAWNASIVAEYVEFGGKTWVTVGAGATIAAATKDGNFPLLMGATLAMVFTVVVLNRLIWRRLYRLAAERYRME